MPEQPHADLHELAQMLRQADHLDPEAQEAVAGLVEELGKALDPTKLPPGEASHLAASVAQLAKALREEQGTGRLAAARDRLEKAILRAEVDAPVATGLARRLIDTLANFGI